METATMGKVLVAAKIENLSDLFKVEEGRMSPDEVRAVEVSDAMIDTGATFLCVPRQMVDQLGLRPGRTCRVRTAGGLTDMTIFNAVKLTVQGRDCTIDVAAIPDDCPVLIGQVPLEILDFVVDPKGQKLIGNPEHGGEQMIELFTFFPKS